MYCEYHKYEHGPLYVCTYYPDDVKERLKKHYENFRKHCCEGTIKIKEYEDGHLISDKTWNELVNDSITT